MVSIEESLDKLGIYLLELEYKYISNHVDPFEDPEEYKLDVRSYCVLSHAAFEEFVENICLYTLNEIEDKFVNTQRISFSTLCLLHFNGYNKTIDNESWKDDDSIYDYLLNQIRSVKSDFSKYIMNQNHGVGLKYLKRLLVPLGLYAPLDIRFSSALDKLTQFRGGYAHTSHRNIKSLSPEDAKKYVWDVYDMMVELANKSRKISYYSIH